MVNGLLAMPTNQQQQTFQAPTNQLGQMGGMLGQAGSLIKNPQQTVLAPAMTQQDLNTMSQFYQPPQQQQAQVQPQQQMTPQQLGAGFQPTPTPTPQQGIQPMMGQPLNVEQVQQPFLQAQQQAGQFLSGTTMGQVQQALSNPFSTEGLTEIPGAKEGFAAQKQQVANTIMSQFANRMEPQFSQEQEQFRQMMANRGIPEDSEQYQRELAGLSQRQQDARQEAMNQAFLMAGEEQNRLVGLSGQQRERELQERLLGRNIPLQEAQSLYGLGQQERLAIQQAEQARGIADQEDARVRELALQQNQLQRDLTVYEGELKQQLQGQQLEHALRMAREQAAAAMSRVQAQIGASNSRAAAARQQQKEMALLGAALMGEGETGGGGGGYSEGDMWRGAAANVGGQAISGLLGSLF